MSTVRASRGTPSPAASPAALAPAALAPAALARAVLAAAVLGATVVLLGLSPHIATRAAEPPPAPATPPSPASAAVSSPSPAPAPGTAPAPICPEPYFKIREISYFRGVFAPPTEVLSMTVCEKAGGALLVMKRNADTVEAYVCGFENRFSGPELETELATSSVEAVAEKRVPTCPLDGTREARVEGPPGKRTLIVGCAASIPPRSWCVEPRAIPGPYGRGCITSTCPAGTDHIAFRGSAGACIACPAGKVDLAETAIRNPDSFSMAGGLPFVSPASVTWICKARASVACRPAPAR